MLAKTIQALKDARIDTWLINETKTEREERYFIKKREDTRRGVSLYELSLTVYRDFDKDGAPMRGMTQIRIKPGMTDEELSAAIRDAYYAASFVANPFFELAAPCRAALTPDDAPFDPAAAVDKAAKALYKPDVNADAFINSAELFAERMTRRVVCSNGTDVSYRQSKVSGEIVAQCKTGQDVELFRAFEYQTLDEDALSKLSADLIASSRDRAKATKQPKAGNYALILSDQHMAILMSLYLEKSDAAMIYAKYSNYATGKNVQGEAIQGEKLNITLVPDAPYSADGIPMPERTLIKDGVVTTVTGATRFCRYLGIEPTGSYERVRVENGSVPFHDLKKAPCLWPVAFSDFQMDSFTGHFGGEIRLAYLYDGENVRLLTGGSVNGSLLIGQENMVFSLERYTDSQYDGPRAVRIEGVSVSGE